MTYQVIATLNAPAVFFKRAARLSVICAALGLCACDLLSSADDKVVKAERQLDSGDYRAAMMGLKSVLEDEPEHIRARLALARLSLQLGDGETAQKEFERALGAGARRQELRELETEILLARGQFAESVTRLQSDRSLPAARRLTLLAKAEMGRRNYPPAQLALDEAARLSPRDAAVLLQRARLQIVQQQFPQALRSVDDALSVDPKLAEASVLRGKLLMLERQYPAAIRAFLKAREANQYRLSVPEEFERLAGLAEAQIAEKDIPAATGTVKQLESRFAGSIPTHFLRARLALLQDDYRTAITELQKVTRLAPDFVPARLLLGASLLSQGTLEQAQAELSQLLSRQPDHLEARKLLAQVYIARGKPEQARQTLLDAGQQPTDDAQLDWLMGAALLQSGSLDEGLGRLERSLAAAPTNQTLRLQLARAYIGAARRDKALAVLDAIPASGRDAQTQQLLVVANIMGRPAVEAKRTLERLAADNSGDAPLLATIGQYAMTSGDAATARIYFEKSIALDPKNVSAHMSLARLEYAAGRAEGSIKELKTVLAIEPKNQEAFIALARIELARQQRSQALEWLERAIAADPAALDARLRLAQLAFGDKDPKRARGLLEQTVTIANRRAEVLDAAGQVSLGGGQFDDALAFFDAAFKGGLQSAKINIARAELALGRVENARQTLEAAQSQDSKSAKAALMLVELDARQNRIEEALRRVAAMRAKGIAPAAADELTGDVNLSGKRFAAAAAAYQKAAAQAPSRGLAMKLYNARRGAGVAAPAVSLIQWLEKFPDDYPVRRALAEYYQQSGNARGAIAEYERLAGTSAKDPIALNNLAWLYFENGDRRSLALAQRAYGIAADNPAIADTYGWILTEQGKPAEGLPILQKASVQAPDNGDIRYHLAAAHARSGNVPESAKILKALLDSKTTFAERARAEQLLRTLTPAGRT